MHWLGSSLCGHDGVYGGSLEVAVWLLGLVRVGICSANFPSHFLLLSQTKVLVHEGPIQSYLVIGETSAGRVPLVSLQV